MRQVQDASHPIVTDVQVIEKQTHTKESLSDANQESSVNGIITSTPLQGKVIVNEPKVISPIPKLETLSKSQDTALKSPEKTEVISEINKPLNPSQARQSIDSQIMDVSKPASLPFTNKVSLEFHRHKFL